MRDHISIGVVADCQYADADAEPIGRGRYYRETLGKLDQAVQTFNTHGVDLVLHLGDLVDRAPADAHAATAVLKKCTAPVRHLLGNHDLLAVRGDRQAALDMLGMATPYFGLLIDKYRIVCLDTNEDSPIGELEESPRWRYQMDRIQRMAKNGQPNAMPWNGGVGEAQLAWLKGQLQIAEDNGEQAIVVAHHPLAQMSAYTALNADQVLSLLDGFSCVDIVLTGHDHRGNFVIRNNVPHLTLRAMVDTQTNAYAIVTLNGTRISVKGFGREPSRVVQRTAGLRPAQLA